jgi:hypothetical protein
MKELKKCSQYVVGVINLFIAKILMKRRHFNSPRMIRQLLLLRGGVGGGRGEGGRLTLETENRTEPEFLNI